MIGGKGLEREVEMAIRRLKIGKVAGKNSLGGEVWKYAGEGVKKTIWEICDKV